MLRIALFALLALTTPATAQMTLALAPVTPVLKAHVTVANDVVRLGDFIENAGSAAQIAIFRSPDLGVTGAVPAERVLEAARAHDLLAVDANGISEVTVTRASRKITPKDIEERIAQIVAERRGADAADLQIKLDRIMPTIQIDPTMTVPLQVTRLADDARTGSFDIVLDLPGAGARGFPLRVSGTAVETAQTVVLARSLSRSDIVHESDLTVERHPKSETNRDVVSDMASVAGLALRRNLRAGQTLRASDLMKPELVHRNDFVTLVYEMPGIVLTSRGKAIEAGSEGEVVAVMNTQSRRTVQGTVTAAGTVAVTSMTPRFAANTISETTGSVPAQRSRSE